MTHLAQRLACEEQQARRDFQELARLRIEVKVLQNRVDGLQVRYELACNGRRIAEKTLNDLAHNARKEGRHAEAAWIYEALNGCSPSQNREKQP